MIRVRPIPMKRRKAASPFRFRIVLVLSIILSALVMLWFHQAVDRREMEEAGAVLAQRVSRERLSANHLKGLPEPARRYFDHTFVDATHRSSSVRLGYEGTLRQMKGGELASFTAEETLSTAGFLLEMAVEGEGDVWELFVLDGTREGERSAVRRSWTRLGIPSGQEKGGFLTRELAGSMLSRIVWLPELLVPEEGRQVVWEAVDDSRALFRLPDICLTCSAVIQVTPEGGLVSLEVRRWLGDKQLTWIADEFADERIFAGHRLPTHFRARWQTTPYDEFETAFTTLREANFPDASPQPAKSKPFVGPLER